MTIEVNGTQDQWFALLQSWEREAVSDVLSHCDGNALLAAETWISMSTTRDVIPHSSSGPRPSAVKIFLAEFYEFICGDDPKYDDARKEAGASLTPRVGVASTLSALLGAQVGLAAALIAPAVTLLLVATSSAGRETMCQKLAQILEDHDT